MIEDNSNTRTPIIRFQGFNGEWEKKKIGDIAIVLQDMAFQRNIRAKNMEICHFVRWETYPQPLIEEKWLLTRLTTLLIILFCQYYMHSQFLSAPTIFAKIGEAIRSNKRIRTGVPCLIDNNAAA